MGMEDGPISVVFKFDIHCEDCAHKLRRKVKKFKGVEAVASDISASKLTVIGKVNPFELPGKLESKMHTKVEIIVAEKKEESSAEKEKRDKKNVAAAASGQDAAKAASEAAVAATLEAIRREYYNRWYSNYQLRPLPSFREESPNDCSIM